MIAVIGGTRPEILKVAPVLWELEKQGIPHVFIMTGQHRELADDMVSHLGLKPDVHFHIMEEGQSLDHILVEVTKRLSPELAKRKPDCVLVQGDTTTAMASALTAFHQRIPVGHIEAGLRTGDPYSPFPEEMNRKMVGCIADSHFAPTPEAAQNLLREGVEPSRVHITGNTIVDTLLRLEGEKQVEQGNEVLITLHRRELFQNPQHVKAVGRALTALMVSHEHLQFRWPVHPSPKVAELASALEGLPNFQRVAPLPYLDFIQALRRSFLVITDSGGIQEEAASLGKGVLVVRESTERPEAIEAGYAVLVGYDEEALIRAFHNPPSAAGTESPFGDGTAAQAIVRILKTKYTRH